MPIFGESVDSTLVIFVFTFSGEKGTINENNNGTGGKINETCGRISFYYIGNFRICNMFKKNKIPVNSVIQTYNTMGILPNNFISLSCFRRCSSLHGILSIYTRWPVGQRAKLTTRLRNIIKDRNYETISFINFVFNY